MLFIFKAIFLLTYGAFTIKGVCTFNGYFFDREINYIRPRFSIRLKNAENPRKSVCETVDCGILHTPANMKAATLNMLQNVIGAASTHANYDSVELLQAFGLDPENTREWHTKGQKFLKRFRRVFDFREDDLADLDYRLNEFEAEPEDQTFTIEFLQVVNAD